MSSAVEREGVVSGRWYDGGNGQEPAHVVDCGARVLLGGAYPHEDVLRMSVAHETLLRGYRLDDDRVQAGRHSSRKIARDREPAGVKVSVF